MTEQEKKMWQDDLKMISKLNAKVDELQEKIDKAIEYIDKNKNKTYAPYGDNEDYDYEVCLNEDDVKDLLEILKVSDNNE